MVNDVRGARPPLRDCRRCGDPIRFVTLINTGRRMPVNPEPDPNGCVKLYGLVGQTWHGSMLGGKQARAERLNGAELLMPHAATCPEHPGRRERAARARTQQPPAPQLF